jgi:hypothetical protein
VVWLPRHGFTYFHHFPYCICRLRVQIINPLLLDTVKSDISLLRPFRFEEFWTHHPDCYSTINLAWSPSHHGSPRHILNHKLRSTKVALKLWNRLSFGNIQQRINLLTTQLDTLQRSPILSNFSSQEQELQKAIDDLLPKEEILWRSKSR